MKRALHIISLAAIMIICLTSALFANAADTEENETSGRVKIALIDTGVSDSRGMMDADRLLPGYNYLFSDGDTEDREGHGTYIAGIIIGASGGGGSIPAASESAALVPLVYYTDDPGMVTGAMVTLMCRAIYDAVDTYGCRVINISAGISQDDRSLQAAVECADKKGAVVVSAVGNANEKAPNLLYYPAAYESVIGVGAVDKDGRAATFSQRNESVMIAAPGVDIITVAVGGGSEFMRVSGTSYSTAYVSALAADMFEKNPNLTPAQVRFILQKTAKRTDSAVRDNETGYGVIDRAAAMEYCLAMMKNAAMGFVDVESGAWYYSAVDRAVSLGYMNGIRADAFEPDSCLTRAMTVTVLKRQAETSAAAQRTLAFKDVPYSAWYWDALSWANDAGVIKGYTDGSFRPDENVTREDFCVMLYRLSGSPAADKNAKLSFSDASEISGYAYDAVKWAVGRGIINGMDARHFRPKSHITRAQAAAMLTRG